ncbi:MAG TPA: hydroxymethylbilane synthase [Acidimicrobiales bacterium]|nr:hydroxymethylbilane synthase [Acidimicrobiales bacterium]
MTPERPSGQRLRIATRGSSLARWQAEHVAHRLRQAHPGLDVDLVVVETLGDRSQQRAIWELGGQGVFVKEVQAAVVEGRADLAVHSAKDLPSSPSLATPGLALAAVPQRGDARDALVGRSLSAIPVGGTVATGANRRRAQLVDLRPDLTFAGLRGNIETRLGRARDFSAVVVAAVALERLGRQSEAAEVLEPAVMVPQVGQGALAVECRQDDAASVALVAVIDHRPSRRAVEAERGFLATLGGGCELPAGAFATEAPDGGLHLRAVLATLDGRMVLRDALEAPPEADPTEVGRSLARRLLDAGGGRSLLAEAVDVACD